jgi:hypothetical protein
MTATIGEMTAAIRDNNIRLGWRRPEGGPGDNTLGDYTALAHTEVAEATTAYRRHRLADMTRPPCGKAAHTGLPCPEHGPAKPEGVGSELADVLIRLLDTADVFKFRLDPDFELGDLPDLDPRLSDPDLPELVTFADHMTWLHRRIDQIGALRSEYAMATALRCLVTIARKHGFNLDAEYERKHAYNATREYQHGGTLTDVGA